MATKDTRQVQSKRVRLPPTKGVARCRWVWARHRAQPPHSTARPCFSAQVGGPRRELGEGQIIDLRGWASWPLARHLMSPQSAVTWLFQLC